MSVPPSRSYLAGLRGRHKHLHSPETKKWAEVSAGTAWLGTGEAENPHVDGRVDPPQAVSEAPTASLPAAPILPRPPWMSEADYQALLALRGALQK